MTEQQGANPAVQPLGQLPALGKQFQTDSGDLAVFLLDKDPDFLISFIACPPHKM